MQILQTDPYYYDLLAQIGVHIRQHTAPTRKPNVEKCLHCQWGKLTGNVIFCPFIGCMRTDPIFDGLQITEDIGNGESLG